jgi:hypothetical protein
MEHQPTEAVRFIRNHGTMLPDYAKSKEMQNVASIKAMISMARFCSDRSHFIGL